MTVSIELRCQVFGRVQDSKGVFHQDMPCVLQRSLSGHQVISRCLPNGCHGRAGTLLSLESVGEVMDYWGHNAGPITWRLTEAQVKEVLGQRTDFEPHEIAALDL